MRVVPNIFMFLRQRTSDSRRVFGQTAKRVCFLVRSVWKNGKKRSMAIHTDDHATEICIINKLSFVMPCWVTKQEKDFLLGV